MKIRKEVLDVYKAVHTWTGIIAGLALFIAFYAGALTVFKHDLAAWVAAPAHDARPVNLDDADRLIEETLRARPDAAEDFTLTLRATDAQPAQLSWNSADGTRQFLANFDSDGKLVVNEREPTAVAELVDNLHRTAGFVPGDVEVGVLVIGVIAMMYGLALISGLILLLPTLVKDVFAFRLGKNLKLLWKDAHNALGFFSLPFHLVIALTTVVFAFHDQIYDTQNVFIYEGALMDQWRLPAPKPETPSLVNAPAEGGNLALSGAEGRPASPVRMLADLRVLSPGFEPHFMDYRDMNTDRPTVRVHGVDPNYMMRYDAFAIMHPYTGEVLNASYLPGHTQGWTSWLTVIFALHFATFGGATVKWIYFLLGMAGAFLFYSGNLLWIESRRRRAQNGTEPQQKRSVRIMAALTVGVSLGCIAGISLSLVAGKWLHGHVSSLNTWHVIVYYAVFFACIAWSLLRGASRSAVELLWLCTIATLFIPLTSLLGVLVPETGVWANGSPSAQGVDISALFAALCFGWMARVTQRRQQQGQPDSVWAASQGQTANQLQSSSP